MPDIASGIPDSFGSFLVFRKLEQNVKAFNNAKDKLPKVKDVSGADNDDLAGAMNVGKFENSLPVVKSVPLIKLIRLPLPTTLITRMTLM